MSAAVTAELSTGVPERSVVAPPPAEKAPQSVKPNAKKMAEVIGSLGDGHSPDPDKSLKAILDLPTEEPAEPISEPPKNNAAQEPISEGINQALRADEASAYRITLQALSEKITQEADSETSSKLRQEMTIVVTDYLQQLPEDKVAGFIAEFNQNNPGLLKSQEFRLLQSRGEKIIMVDESGNLGTINVTSGNARTMLGEIKIKDETIRGKSYELRREIVRRSNGEIATHEAYTYSSDIPQGNELDAFLDDPNNWVPERRALQQQIIDQEFAKALALSARLEDTEPTVYALRGNTAAGKTTITRNDELFRKALDEKGEPSGAINPDTYKTGLKSSDAIDGRQTITHKQTHEEGSMIARRISGKIADSESSMVIDKRMNKAKNIAELISIAEQHGKSVRILDVDVSLETSLIRVLGRKIGSTDPIPPFDAVAEGFEGVRQNRATLIQQVINDPKIKDYVLYVADDSGTSIKAAQKVNGEFIILEGQEEAFQRAVSKDTDSTITRMAETVIDDVYIEGILSRTPESIRDKVRISLERYRGKTMKEALDSHATKINEGPPTEAEYLQAAIKNFETTSRTAAGMIDVSASVNKASQIQEGLTRKDTARIARENFTQTISRLFHDKDRSFTGPQDLRSYIEGVAQQINQGITKENVLIRQEDSEKYPYTRVADLETTMQQFYQEFFTRLQNPNEDPVDLTAWVEYRIDVSDHFFADGCGKTAKAISSWVLMRRDHNLPQYTTREDLLAHAPTKVRGENDETDKAQFERWRTYYKSLF